MKTLTCLLVVFAIPLSFSLSFKKQKIQVKDVQLVVEIAQTSAEKARGLMFRKSLAPNEGMLFIYPREEILSFWMKNTYLPLSIGFFNKDKVLIDIQDMAPFAEKIGNPPSYRSKAPSQYALEVPQGWFKKNKIGLGSKLILQPD